MSRKNEGFSADVIEISERWDEAVMKPFYVVVARCDEKPKLRFDKRIKIREIH